MNRLHATKDFWLAALRADGPALWDAVAQTGPDAPVPTGADQTVADLAHHLTGLLRWVRATVARGVTDRPPAPEDTPAAEWSETLDHLRRELTGTIETLEALDPDFPAWNWAPQPKRAVGERGQKGTDVHFATGFFEAGLLGAAERCGSLC